jgi:D-alanyl-lipoteichoic acid acyltransferase DltB (MBOAT superfamily)
MLFNSFVFFLFLAVVLPLFYLLPTKKSKNIFLLIASYFFYGYWDWRFCSLLVVSTFIDYFIGLQISKSENKKQRKRLLLISVFTNLGILFTFKYFNFFIDNLQEISDSFNYNLDFLHINLILPIGISFYTFQTLTYTVDIYNRKIKPTTDFVDFAVFVSFFPQLVAGPIERAKYLLPQLSKKLKPTYLQIKQGITLIVIGLFRKVMIGDTAGKYVDHIFDDLSLYKSIEIIFAILLFSIQIYADFSGYSHMARGTAKLLGVELVKNFEQPYLSKNITEFWRRWHISLSSFLRDYLYIPLGGNRKKNRTYINLMITMLLGGLWHGASWNFIIWGGLHGVYLILHKILIQKKVISKTNSKFGNILSIIVTFILVTFTWLFFRSQSMESTAMIFNKIWFWETSEYTFEFIKIGFSYLSVIVFIDIIEAKYGHTGILKVKSTPIVLGILSALFMITMTYMFQADASPFIYFQF